MLMGALLSACNGNGFSSVTSPTPPPSGGLPSPVPPTIPGPTTFNLSGRVTETAPTPSTGIGGAVVRLLSGANAGRSATTNALGFYAIPDVAPGTTIGVSAEGYVGLTRESGDGRDGSNFQLMPVLRTMTTTVSDEIDGAVGTCHDGVTQRSCHIVTIAIHNSGPIEAELTWQPPDAADLNLTLFRTGSANFLARSASVGSAPERIKVDIEPGATYELRITYAAGADDVRYTLRATHPN
jgi:hypothetical protein